MSPVTTPALARIEAAAVSDIGLARRFNEDSVIAADPVFVVADGMGGHQAGGIASAIVAEEMGTLAGSVRIDIAEVKARLATARQRIFEVDAPSRELAAGTTVSGVVVVSEDRRPYWLVVNLGDSRTYRLAGTTFEQLSVDHSEVQELVDNGELSIEQARQHPRRNIITRALGAGMRQEPDFWLVPIEEGDRILVCSDGLTSEVVDSRIAGILLDQLDPAGAAHALVEAALNAGGRDNISVIVVDAWEVAGAEPDEVTCEEFADEAENDTIPRHLLEDGGQP